MKSNLKFVRDLQEELTLICTQSSHQHQIALAANQLDRDVSKVCQVLELQTILKNVSDGRTIDFFEVSWQVNLLSILIKNAQKSR